MKYFIGCLVLLVIILFTWLLFSAQITAVLSGKNDLKAEVLSSPEAVVPTFTPPDASGRQYRTVTIGGREWMAENLANPVSNCDDSLTLKFVNGREQGPGVALYVLEPRYAYYDDRPEDGYGIIYNHAAVTKCELCPSGYRVATKADWEELIATLGGVNNVGQRILPGGNSNFGARLGGRIDDFGSVLGQEFIFWWTPDEAPRQIEASAWSPEVNIHGTFKLKGQPKRMGAYVRCVRE